MFDTDEDTTPTQALTFFLFAGYRYYPGGGMEDYKSAHATFEDAEAAFTQSTGYEWANIAQLTSTGLVHVRSYGV